MARNIKNARFWGEKLSERVITRCIAIRYYLSKDWLVYKLKIRKDWDYARNIEISSTYDKRGYKKCN